MKERVLFVLLPRCGTMSRLQSFVRYYGPGFPFTRFGRFFSCSGPQWDMLYHSVTDLIRLVCGQHLAQPFSSLDEETYPEIEMRRAVKDLTCVRANQPLLQAQVRRDKCKTKIQPFYTCIKLYILRLLSHILPHWNFIITTAIRQGKYFLCLFIDGKY